MIAIQISALHSVRMWSLIGNCKGTVIARGGTTGRPKFWLIVENEAWEDFESMWPAIAQTLTVDYDHFLPANWVELLGDE